MKIVLNIFCWLLAAYCIYFPFSYFGKEADRKEINVSHILVATQEEAENIKKQIEEEGKSFEEMAEANSLDSAANRGNLGYGARDRFADEFSKVAFKLDKETVSEPVKTEYGWHLIKVYDIKNYSDKENFQ